MTPGAGESLRSPGRKLLALATCLVLLMDSAAVAFAAWLPRKTLLYGIAQGSASIVDGNVKSVIYPLLRAEAWLAAVQKAEGKLPRAASGLLRQLAVPLRLGKAAVAALLFPLDVVTPEQAFGAQARVFLKSDAGIGMDQVLADPWRLLLEMAIVRETEQVAQGLRHDLPQSEQEASADLRAMEAQAALLRQLWLAAQLNAVGSRADAEEWDALQPHRASVPLLLLLASRKGADSPQATDLANRAIELCQERELAGDNTPLWIMLGAYGNYLRAQEQERLGQPALAETDLDTAINRMRQSGLLPGIELDATVARGALRRKRDNVPGMCADYRTACGLGFCQYLARARREGLCAP